VVASPRRCYIGLGANLGDPADRVVQAMGWLDALPGTAGVARSSLYRSPPQGPQDQPDFCNAVCALDTALEPMALLDHLQALEQRAGRTRGEHWGPRTLDLDIISYDQRVVHHARLTLPHPWAHRRAFVLVPWLEIAPDACLPGLGAAREHLSAADRATVRPWSAASPSAGCA